MSELRSHVPFRGRLRANPNIRLTVPVGGPAASAQTVPAATPAPSARPKHSVWDDTSAPGLTYSSVAAATWWKDYKRRLRITDSLAVVTVVLIAYLGRFGVDGPDSRLRNPETSYAWLSAFILVAWLVSLDIYHTRDSRIFGVGATEYKRLIQATFKLFGALAIVMVIFRVDVVRGYFAIALPLGLVLLSASRWLWRQWLNKQRAGGKYLARVVVIGDPADVEYVVRQVAKNPGVGYQIAGAALPALDKALELKPPWYRIPVLSTLADVGRIVAVTAADAVIVAGPVPGGARYIRELGWRLEDSRTELVLASSLTNVAGPRIHMRPVEGLPLTHVELPQYAGGKHFFKRVVDVLVSAVALLVLSPILAVLSVVVWHDSPGPVIFRQERVGREGNNFEMLKFRSMVRNAQDELDGLRGQNEGAGSLFKIRKDPRVTSCGRWMRKYSLDELPQFWNVLMGDMSLVGPRPPLPEEVATYEKFTNRRLLIKPGITGLWQINGRSTLDWEESIRLDLYYVENWSFTGDLIIMWRTFRAMRSPVGAY